MAILDFFNNPSTALAAGLLSPTQGGAFGPALLQGIIAKDAARRSNDVSNLNQLQGQLSQQAILKAQQQNRQAKEQQERLARIRQSIPGLLGVQGGQPLQGPTIGGGLLQTQPTGMYAQDPQMAGILGGLLEADPLGTSQALLASKMKTQDPTTVVQNMIAAGYQPGTPEFEQAMRDYLAKSTGTTVNNILGGEQQIRALTPEEKAVVSKGEPFIDNKGKVQIAPDLPQVQRVAAGYADRMVRTGNIMDEIDYDIAGSIKGRAGALPLDFQPAEFQQIQQAQNDWIRAKLRKESGAVIAPEEMEDERKTYFPQPGDSPKTVMQKKLSRDAATKAMIEEAGKAYQPITPVQPAVPGQPVTNDGWSIEVVE